MKNALSVLLLVCALAVFIFYHTRYDIFFDAKPFTSGPDILVYDNSTAKINYVDINDSITQDVTVFEVNAPMDFNYKSKDEIYEIRKKFVGQSLFKNPDYEPNESIFGQIENGVQWIALKYQLYSTASAEGYSEESRFINNPSALIMLDLPYNNATYGRYWGEDMYLLPESVKYYKADNAVKVVYSMRKFFNEIHPAHKDKFLYSLDGLNARDFGYPYIFVYESTNITFHPESVKDNVGEIQKFIHLGMSSGFPRNNGSPFQEDLGLRIDRLPAYVKIKLWRKYPKSAANEADIMTELYFNN